MEGSTPTQNITSDRQTWPSIQGGVFLAWFAVSSTVVAGVLGCRKGCRKTDEREKGFPQFFQWPFLFRGNSIIGQQMLVKDDVIPGRDVISGGRKFWA